MMQDQNNPYATPSAVIKDVVSEGDFGDLKLFTSQGRLGRLRYLLYSLGIGFVGILLAVLLMTIPVVGEAFGVLIYIGFMVITIFLTIQRCHDFNVTGWLSLVILIPFVSLLFYIIPGTKATNQYGLQPPPNSKGIKIGAFLLLAVFVLSFVAAISVSTLQSFL